jgi:hypothetical protein
LAGFLEGGRRLAAWRLGRRCERRLGLSYGYGPFKNEELVGDALELCAKVS